jgi:uncharacterized protein (DUF885 family)
MHSTRRTFLLSGAALAACTPTMQAVGGASPSAATPFAAQVEAWTQEVLRASPETATSLALPEDYMGGRYNNRLDDRSAEGLASAKSMMRRLDSGIRAVDPTTLNAADKLTYDILSAAFAFNSATADAPFGNFGIGNGPTPYVLDQQASAFINLPDFFDSQCAVANADDTEAYLSRLAQVDSALDQESARAQDDAARGVIPPDFIIDKTLVALNGALETPAADQTYVTALKRKLDELVTSGAMQRAAADTLVQRAETITRDEILPAHQRTGETLRALRARASHDAGIGARPGGADYYAKSLAYFTTTRLTPDEVHTIGLARVAELQARADQTLRAEGLTRGTVGQRLAAYTADPARRYSNDDAGRAQILADTRARIERVQRDAPQWFAHLPRAAIEVRRMPPVVEAVQSAAYYQRPALDGSRPGVYYMTLKDMTKVSRVDLATITHHEAVPGHHFQIALAQEQDMPLIRRIAIYNAYVEGWALYAEQLVDEMGYYDDYLEGRIGMLRWALWRGVRLVVDTGVHAKGWSREQTERYMLDNLGDDPTIISNELDRYCAWPGQACGYEIGRREIVRTREAARAAMGDRFTLRGFHDAVLLPGAMPLTVMADQVRAWSGASS